MVPKWRANRARSAAQTLDELVDAQLPLLAGLSEASRRRAADHLADLVMLGQAYRQYAAGWINRAELNERGNGVIARLGTPTEQPAQRCADWE
ncbi:MAG: hypothetical protein J2O49_01450 [Sciscionella sp.]|nr:hypothetical protein [Sciscionella sp.]